MWRISRLTSSELDYCGPFVITGLSGSGKTVLSRSLEDVGYLCVDNIPLELVVELFERSASEVQRLAVVLDVRAEGFAERFPAILGQIRNRWPQVRLLFVEASPEVLLRRFSVARRPHPLRGRNLEAAIREEHVSLQAVRQAADLVLDTTSLNPHELRRQALGLGGLESPASILALDVESFSYLYGVPPTASLVFDVRFLPNPYFVEELRPLAGDDPKVMAWLGQFKEVGAALERMLDLTLDLLPRYGAELKTHVTIAAGCTGGRHRSVFTAHRIAEATAAAGYQVSLHHRDRERWRYP